MNDKEIIVSLIVPVYNVEKYIEKCVNSIMNQEIENIEIILVDDGSKDNSGNIIDTLSENDKRIRVIHKENGGVSSARNEGLNIAKGKYIMFVDGDDYVEKDYVSYFVSLVTETNCEVGMGHNCFMINENTQIKLDNKRVIPSEKIIEEIYLLKMGVAVWNKIYKRSFLKENNITFDNEIWYGEGMLFNILCLQYTNNVVVGERFVYHQVYNPDSAMRKFSLKSNHCGIESLYRQKKAWKKKNKRIQKAWDFHYRCFFMVILKGLIETNAVKENKEEFIRCKKELRKNTFLPLGLDIPLKRKITEVLAGLFPVWLAKHRAKKVKMIKKEHIVL